MKHRIEYRLKRGESRRLWSWFDGTRTDAIRSAKGLLESLRDDSGHTKARVWVDGHGVRRKESQ